jgi:hypothetical protein
VRSDSALDDARHRLFVDVLWRLQEVGVLRQIVLIGSWCKYYYNDWFQNPEALSPNKTTDIDFLISLPFRFQQKIDVPAALAPLGFRVEFNNTGYMTLSNPELHIDFIVPEKGRGVDHPITVEKLGIRASALRYMGLLLEHPITIEKNDLHVTLPHPVNFGIHKLLVSTRRSKKVKAAKDFLNGCEILAAVMESGKGLQIKAVWSSLPLGWRRTALQSFTKGLLRLHGDVDAPRITLFEGVRDFLSQP